MKCLLFGFSVGIIIIAACNTYQALPSSKQPVSRVIILDERDTISEKEIGGFTSWQCKDFVYGGRTLVEVGYFDDPFLKDIGFVLYDGGNRGESGNYKRVGLNHRWDWGSNGGNYAFIVEQMAQDFTMILLLYQKENLLQLKMFISVTKNKVGTRILPVILKCYLLFNSHQLNCFAKLPQNIPPHDPCHCSPAIINRTLKESQSYGPNAHSFADHSPPDLRIHPRWSCIALRHLEKKQSHHHRGIPSFCDLIH